MYFPRFSYMIDEFYHLVPRSADYGHTVDKNQKGLIWNEFWNPSEKVGFKTYITLQYDNK